jgi:hypothetical protein
MKKKTIFGFTIITILVSFLYINALPQTIVKSTAKKNIYSISIPKIKDIEYVILSPGSVLGNKIINDRFVLNINNEKHRKIIIDILNEMNHAKPQKGHFVSGLAYCMPTITMELKNKQNFIIEPINRDTVNVNYWNACLSKGTSFIWLKCPKTSDFIENRWETAKLQQIKFTTQSKLLETENKNLHIGKIPETVEYKGRIYTISSILSKAKIAKEIGICSDNSNYRVFNTVFAPIERTIAILEKKSNPDVYLEAIVER